MEPRLFSHGYVETLPDADPASVPSMEPRLFSHGYAGGRHQGQPGLLPPSMEPRLFSHGYYDEIDLPAIATEPSMEPRLFSHGYLNLGRLARLEHFSFNGATAFQPWILDAAPMLARMPITLQWSHGFSAMDT